MIFQDKLLPHLRLRTDYQIHLANKKKTHLLSNHHILLFQI
nr:MAG TPA: hypothetical protein [Caudoviricetes sp.]